MSPEEGSISVEQCTLEVKHVGVLLQNIKSVKEFNAKVFRHNAQMAKQRAAHRSARAWAAHKAGIAQRAGHGSAVALTPVKRDNMGDFVRE